MSRGIRSRSFAVAVVSGACALAVASAAIAPAVAVAASTRPVAPIEEATETRRPYADEGYSAERAAFAARRIVDLARKSRPLPPKPKPPAPQVRYGPWRNALCSWYWEPQPLAGGGYLKPGMMIVAHKSLPFGQKIQFSYRGRTCIAVVKDRGPYVGGREFDLGPGTAKALGFDGVDRVSYRLVH